MKSITIKLTPAQFDAALWAIGNFTGGDYCDCNGDKRLYAVMKRTEAALRNGYANQVKGGKNHERIF